MSCSVQKVHYQNDVKCIKTCWLTDYQIAQPVAGLSTEATRRTLNPRGRWWTPGMRPTNTLVLPSSAVSAVLRSSVDTLLCKPATIAEASPSSFVSTRTDVPDSLGRRIEPSRDGNVEVLERKVCVRHRSEPALHRDSNTSHITRSVAVVLP